MHAQLAQLGDAPKDDLRNKPTCRFGPNAAMHFSDFCRKMHLVMGTKSNRFKNTK